MNLLKSLLTGVRLSDLLAAMLPMFLKGTPEVAERAATVSEKNARTFAKKAGVRSEAGQSEIVEHLRVIGRSVGGIVRVVQEERG